MKFCAECVQPDTRPGIVFDRDVCMACQYAKQKVNWEERRQELHKISKWAKSKSSKYDCIIGVSGGKDSHVQALYARDELGLRTLLVNGTPDGITEVGKQNLENLVQQGFDLISLRPNPLIIREAVKNAFFKYCNPVKPTEYPLYASAWLVAENFNIPLVIQGESPGITLGITESIEPTGDATAIVKHNTLSEDYSIWGDNIDDLYFYKLPDRKKLTKLGIRSIYLGYYMKEWSYSNNIEFAVSHGLKGRPNHDPMEAGRLSPYCSIDSDMQIVNQMLKYLKFGFGFVTDEVGYYIREGNMTREEGIDLVERYDGKCAPHYIYELCQYIGISVGKFWQVVDRFVNKELFHKSTLTKEWKPKFKVGS